MLDHVAVQVDNLEASVGFYLGTFAALGFREAMRFPRPGGTVVGLSGPDGFPHFWVSDTADEGQRPIHLAFSAPTRAAVDAVHDAAVSLGVEVLHPPRLWPEYHDSYYGVFLRDPDGHNVEAVCHASE